MERDQPLIGQSKTNASTFSSTFFGFGQSAPRESHVRGDLEMNNEVPAEKAPAPSTFSQFFDTGSKPSIAKDPAAKERKIPTKVEPKVFFSNERTFLSWLNMAVTLSTISLAVIAFADTNKMSQIYGVMLLPVAIAFICYALYTYMRRAIMIRNKEPGPYEDRRGPVILACMLAVAIVINFIVKVVEVMS